MKLIIDIPKEFEEHFNKDKFSDSLARVASDIESFGVPLSGRYEQETITMLRKAFEDATPLEAQPTDKRDCKTCTHSNNGECAYTEECHECMWESKYEQQPSEPRTNLAETSQDCINRTALIQKLNAWDGKAHGIPNYAWKVIRELPPVTPERSDDKCTKI